jgi:hypothetical protein
MKPDSIHPFDRIFKAVCQIESGNDSLAFCIDINGLPSVGIAQIQQIRLDDYNRQTGSHYDLIDCFSQRLSKQIFMFYAQGNYESIAKHWNGRGPMTEIYWKKINFKEHPELMLFKK